MSVLSSERPHDQGVEHGMANNRWNDAAALQATQTIDNAGNGRQRWPAAIATSRKPLRFLD
jgi:hypothetical protein